MSGWCLESFVKNKLYHVHQTSWPSLNTCQEWRVYPEFGCLAAFNISINILCLRYIIKHASKVDRSGCMCAVQHFIQSFFKRTCPVCHTFNTYSFLAVPFLWLERWTCSSVTFHERMCVWLTVTKCFESDLGVLERKCNWKQLFACELTCIYNKNVFLSNNLISFYWFIICCW